jgi:hypothetical protein
MLYQLGWNCMRILSIMGMHQTLCALHRALSYSIAYPSGEKVVELLHQDRLPYHYFHSLRASWDCVRGWSSESGPLLSS